MFLQRGRDGRRVRIGTWNVNGLRARLDRLLAFLDREHPDVLCLQETKTEDAGFPFDALAAAGYHAVHHGQKGRNGVAILSRAPLQDVRAGFQGDPLPDDCRVLRATVAGLRVWCLYVVNGRSVADPMYPLKLAWLEALHAAFRAEDDGQRPDAPGPPAILVGDWNIAPDDRDVHDPALWVGHVHATDEERAALQRFVDAGLRDLHRLHHQGPGPWTWWDYRALAFPKDKGMRIDLAMGTQEVAARCTAVSVDRDERRTKIHPSPPSDHAPVLVDLDWPFDPEPPEPPAPVPKPTTLDLFA